MSRSGNPAPRSLFVDTGAWLAFFSARDRRHADADRLFRDAIGRKIPLHTTNLVLAEVHRLLVFRAGIAAASAALRKLDESKAVSVRFADGASHREAIGWLTRLSDQQISYADATSFAVMNALKCKWVLGFDRDFVIAGFALWPGG